METRQSPWSTPTESELGAADADSALFKQKEAELFDEIDFKVNKSFVRELGDGEPSLEGNVELGDDLLSDLNDQNALLQAPSMAQSNSINSMEEDVSSDSGLIPEDESPTKSKAKKKALKPKKAKDKSPGPRGTKDQISPTKKKRNPRVASRAEMNDDDEGGSVSSPSKGKARNRSISPAKSVSPTKGRGLRKVKDPGYPQTAGSVSGDSQASLKLGADYEDMARVAHGRDNGDPFSATTIRTTSTVGTDYTGSSGSSSGQRNPGSPTKSPSKSPTKRSGLSKTRARDVLQLPKPYNNLKSDSIKKWTKLLMAGKPIDEEEHPTFSEIRFSNALILKVNQQCKQVCGP